MAEAAAAARSQVLSLYRGILREGRKLPIYNRRRYVDVKAKTDFLHSRNLTDLSTIREQIQLAEDMLESLTIMGQSQRAFFAWETDPDSEALVNGKPQRKQPPPRDLPVVEEPEAPKPKLVNTEDF